MSGECVTPGDTEMEPAPQYENAVVAEFAEGLKEAISQLAELKAVARECGADSASELLSDLDEQVTTLLAERDEQIGKLRVVAANFKRDLQDLVRRSQRLREDLPANARFEFAGAVLPVADAIKAAVVSMSESDGAIAEGVDAIGRQLDEALESQGIVKVEAIGQPIDVSQHEPVGTTESSDCPPETVVFVTRNGYLDRTTGKVLRPAQVVVAKPRPVDDGGELGNG